MTSKSPIDHALDLFVYAPVGLAVSARELLPGLVERGREQLGVQIGNAKLIGRLAVTQGQAEAEKAFNRARSSAETTLESFVESHDAAANADATFASAATPAPASPPVRTPRPSTPRPSSPGGPRPTVTELRPEPAPVAAVPDHPVPGTTPVASVDLAIPSYDSLSASQVVPRLSGLTPAELEAVRSYESANRGRKTILGRVAQLQAS